MGADARVDVLLALKAKMEGFDGAATAVPNLSRAVRQAGKDIKQQTRSIGEDVDKLSAKLSLKFSAASIAKGIMGGIGIGSGAALIHLTVDKWVAIWKDSAEYAKVLQERAENIAEAMQATARAAREAFLGGLSPEKQREARLKEAADLEAKMQAAEARRAKSLGGIGWIQKAGDNPLGLSNAGVRVKNFGGENFGDPDTGLGGRDFVQLMQERADAAQLEWNTIRENLIKVRGEISKLDKELADSAKKTEEANQKNYEAKEKEKLAKHQALLKEDLANQKAVLDALERQDQALANLVDKYRSIADPSREFTKQIEEVNFLLRGEKISAQEAADAIANLTRAMEEAEAARVDKALTAFFGPLDEQSKEAFKEVQKEMKAFDREMAQLWNSVSDRAGQAFADVLLEGGNAFRSLAREISRSIIEITARLAIINPVLNAVFGGFKGFSALPTFFNKATAAGGGQFLTSGPTQFTVGDNPGGVELVSVLPLSGVGRSSINGRSVAMAGGGAALVGGGGDTITVHNHFTGGVTAGDLARMLPAIEERAMVGVLTAMQRRRDGFR
jgi:hypothetical protein